MVYNEEQLQAFREGLDPAERWRKRGLFGSIAAACLAFFGLVYLIGVVSAGWPAGFASVFFLAALLFVTLGRLSHQLGMASQLLAAQ